MDARFEVVDNIAVITLGGEGLSPWGTRLEEHRINPTTIKALHKGLDEVEGRDDVHCLIVTGEGKFFSNGLDLRWVESHPKEAEDMQRKAEGLLARLLTFSVPTIAALNGHWCAAGAMLGLTFDYRVANHDRGYFFVPAIDIGLVYSPGMTALMKAKTAPSMYRDMILFAKRYKAAELHQLGVVDAVAPKSQILEKALEIGRQLKSKGKTPLYRRTMHSIKKNLYAEAFERLTDPNSFQEMGFSSKPQGVFAAPKAKL